MTSVGVDWAGRRWVCVVLDGGGVEVAAERTIAGVLDRFADAVAIGVDIPIGLPGSGPTRRADGEARRLVSPSTVFPTFPRSAYECATHRAAVELCRARGWPGISVQSYGLWARIREVEPHAGLVHEVHPEVSFWRLNGETRLRGSKHTWNGFFERRDLLERHGIAIPRALASDVPAVDVVDAAAVAWTAQRIARGEHRTLPAEPEPGEPTISY